MNFLIGCAVWAYKGWICELYPEGTPTADFLKLYSRRFTTVEGNTTFYAVPSAATVSRWVQETPANFQFCLKFPRNVTHQGKLQPHIPQALEFIHRVQPLGKRLGAIFAQLPPSYSPTLLEDLITFLTALPRQDVAIALEVRHPDWFTDNYTNQLTEILQKLGVGKVLLDSRPIYTPNNHSQIECRKPQLPVQFTLTAPFGLIRFISHPQPDINQPFMAEWVNQISLWLQQGKQIYFFVHCPTEERSPANAFHFQQLLQQNTPIPPLPQYPDDSTPQQLSLW
ncbi:DUF72 domain-containing protein [Calothrix sp. 336/3]|uniref:DUF72 domain-containing protein n=1 Tax=Calothrix sp. 336/3 TaxID=1337936 RepID=UPI0004E37E28|nr:DUF72 domain-containing protein [Calothrix sp. 336/3]AKG20036.1 hypothetical protein IJ00_00795 [Calothrix sp. 336/3]